MELSAVILMSRRSGVIKILQKWECCFQSYVPYPPYIICILILFPQLNTLIPGFKNFEDNWAALFMVQSHFNNARATQLKLEREEAKQQAAANQLAVQVDLGKLSMMITLFTKYL